MIGWIYALSGGLLLVSLYHILFPVPDMALQKLLIYCTVGIIGAIGLSAVAICQRLDALRPPPPAPKEPPPPPPGDAAT
jgi:hypothetical protein